MRATVQVGLLEPGDYVIPARARVAQVERFASLAIVEFTDGTASAPVPSGAWVEVYRRLEGGKS